jgi:hypothetical protein
MSRQTELNNLIQEISFSIQKAVAEEIPVSKWRLENADKLNKCIELRERVEKPSVYDEMLEWAKI